MFFDSEHFKQLGAASSRLAAKLANDVIDQSGYVVYGRAFDNDELEAFTTSQSEADTHVGIIVGLSLMGRLKPRGAAVKSDDINEKDLNQALREQNQRLENLLRQSGVNIDGNA